MYIWQGGELIDYARRQYDNVTTREPSVAFGPLYYNVLFPSVARPQSGQRLRIHLGLVYTFTRDGSESHYTWRADAIAELTGSADGRLPFEFVPTLVRPVDAEPCD